MKDRFQRLSVKFPLVFMNLQARSSNVTHSSRVCSKSWNDTFSSSRICSWHFVVTLTRGLIEGPHLLLAPVTSVFILAVLHGEGQGVKHTSRPAPLAVVTSTGLHTQTVSCGGEWTSWLDDKFSKGTEQRFQVQENSNFSVVKSF